MKKLALTLLATGLIGLNTGVFAYDYKENDIVDVSCSEKTKICYLMIGSRIYNLNEVKHIYIIDRPNQTEVNFYIGNGNYENFTIVFSSKDRAMNALKKLLIDGNYQ